MKNAYRELTIEDRRDISRILNGDNWLDSYIENDVRQIVKNLRANGVNTISSCQHDANGDIEYMGIDCISSNVTSTVNAISQIFACMDISGYYVKAQWHPDNKGICLDAIVKYKIPKIHKNDNCEK